MIYWKVMLILLIAWLTLCYILQIFIIIAAKYHGAPKEDLKMFLKWLPLAPITSTYMAYKRWSN